MNEKIKKLSKKMVGLFPTFDEATPQKVFWEFQSIYDTQKDYFEHFSNENIIKLVFYIYSLIKTNDYSLGDKMINNLSFISLIIPSGNKHVEDCKYCRGNQYIRCPECNGRIRDCSNCSGEGVINCEDCNGSGLLGYGDNTIECETCDGIGTETCTECAGDGKDICSMCDNEGEIRCDMCDGDGEIKTDENEFTYYLIATSNKIIINLAELREGTPEPMLSEFEFDSLSDEYIILGYSDGHGLMNLTENEAYCTHIDDEPKLMRGSSGLSFYVKDNGIDKLVELK